MIKTLVLFDIDGTLLEGSGEGILAFAQAIQSVFGIKIADGCHDTAGKTDRLILRELLAGTGFTLKAGDEAKLIAEYLIHARALILERPGRVLPGARELLQRLTQENHIVVGLGTGNLEQMARLKLDLMGLNEFFRIGGFGEDGLSREEIIAAGIRKAVREYRIRFERIAVVGDTPWDIAAGKANGVHSIAVATGEYPEAVLKRSHPVTLVRDLREPDGFLKQLERLASTPPLSGL